MIPIDVLHPLVQSMTKSEKRYFRLTVSLQQGEKAYLRLFDCLDRYELFNDALKEELKTLFPATTIEPARKHLYRVLMKSLRQFESDKSVEEKLMNLIQDSQILFNRGLISVSFEQLEKAKSLALKYEKFMFYILASRQELQFSVRQQFVGWNETKLVEKQEKIRELLEHELTVQQHASLFEVLLLRYWKTGVVRSLQESVRLNDLLLEEHQVLTSQQVESFESQQLHLHFQSAYFLMTDDLEGSSRVLHELDRLFQCHQHLWADRPDHYLHLLNGILQTLRGTEQYDKMEYFLERLQSVSTPSESLTMTVTYQILEHRLHSAVNRGQACQALQIVQNQREANSRDLPRLPIQLQVQLGLTIARIHYNLRDYSQALFQINQILNQPTRSLSHILYISCRLMNLLIHVALDNRDYLHYEIRSIERKLKSEKKWYRAEQFVLTLLKNWLKNKPLHAFKPQARLLLEDPFERQLILELGLKDWFGAMMD
ncbi:hypothetical protein [Larkinella rosea]|uniref:MalT-like TPR region domain-containing protein n=1 Tax=Larkinella rosea TaxID=2025312 RepID=A0A3P1BII2_9BACT|nr:hypothetical protein [Larkinella rosea]RRB00917.1 hypothetical protein EHT25_22275 [Larkinella rosea]